MSKILNEADLEFIQRFFDYELSEKEVEIFDNRIENDIDFKLGVERFQKAYLITDMIDKKRDTPSITPIDEPKKSTKTILLFLVSLVAILCISFYLLKPNTSSTENSSEQIYASVDQYVTNMSNNVTRGDEKEIDINSFSPVELTIYKIKALNKDNDGISADELESLLTEINQDDSKEILYWWLVKANLKDQNINAAKDNLNKIINNPNFNSSLKARQILEKL